jgi:hypothetical protein
MNRSSYALVALIGLSAAVPPTASVQAAPPPPMPALPEPLFDNEVVTIEFNATPSALRSGPTAIPGVWLPLGHDHEKTIPFSRPSDPAVRWKLHLTAKPNTYTIESLASQPGPRWLSTKPKPGLLTLAHLQQDATPITIGIGGVDIVPQADGKALFAPSAVGLILTTKGAPSADFRFKRYQPATNATPGAPATYASAKKIGAASVENVVCGENGGFPDANFDCWKCPDGYSYNIGNLLRPPSDPKTCKKEGKKTNVSPKTISCGEVGGWGPEGGLLDAKCYKCPSGSTHDIWKKTEEAGVCYTQSADEYSAASKMGGTAFCKRGFLDLATQQCWECPPAQPSRSLEPITSARACQTAACGGDGQRPCLLNEAFPSCKSGLVEDPIQNKCVSLLSAGSLCDAVVDALTTNKSSPALDAVALPFAEQLKKASGATDSATKATLLAAAKGASKQSPTLVEYLKAVEASRGVVSKNLSSFKGLFNKQLLCHGKKGALQAELEKLGLKSSAPLWQKSAGLEVDGDDRAALLRRRSSDWLDGAPVTRPSGAGSFLGQTVGDLDPNAYWDRNRPHVYAELGIKTAAAVVAGLELGVSVVTDFHGNSVLTFFFAPQLASNVSAASMAFVGGKFQTKYSEIGGTTLSDPAAWGWEFGVGVGEVVGIATSLSFDLRFEKYQGISLAVGAEMGVLPGEGSIAAQWSYRLREL